MMLLREDESLKRAEPKYIPLTTNGTWCIKLAVREQRFVMHVQRGS